jgi:hypothetical protein
MTGCHSFLGYVETDRRMNGGSMHDKKNLLFLYKGET